LKRCNITVFDLALGFEQGDENVWTISNREGAGIMFIGYDDR